MTDAIGRLRLGDYAVKIGSGATPRGGQDVYVTTGTSLVRSQNVYINRFERAGLAFIDDVEAEKLSSVAVEAGDVLLNITGDSVARVCQAPAEILPARVNQHVMIIRTRTEELDQTFLRYYLASPQMQSYMLGLAGAGATRNALTKGMVEGFQIPDLDISIQREIARILGTLDDKIDLNRKMNATLEEMARALFKSWFVDFDPVRAKAEGRDPAGMDAETAALFPDAFEDSPLGEIPRGWRVAPIGDVVRAVGGSTPSTAVAEYWDGGTINWATPKDMSRLSSPVLLNTERQITKAGLSQISSGLVPRGTVLLSSRAPVGYLAISETPVAINQGFIAMVCDESFPSLYALLWAETNLDVIKNRASGTTFLEISKRNFRPILALVPPLEVLNSFVDVAQPMYRRIVENLKETKTLAEMRDALLPRLMRGELVGV